MNLKDLKKEIPFQWKVQSFVSKDAQGNPTKATCVAYVDARDVMDLLDEVLGEGNWQDDYKSVDGKLLAGIGIKVTNDVIKKHTNKTLTDDNSLQIESKYTEWIWKWDTGTESAVEKDKGQMSDAFKRAAVKWGVGRFLYDMEIKFVNVNQFKKPVDENNKPIYDLTEYFNLRNPVKPRPIEKTSFEKASDAIKSITKISTIDTMKKKIQEHDSFTDKEKIQLFIELTLKSAELM